MVGNTFFSQDQYGVDCSLPTAPAYDQYDRIMGTKTVPARLDCKITSAPVVDMAWVAANLDAQGYTYEISYPQTNFGNGRALINWVKACWTPVDPGMLETMYCYRGMARLEGAPDGWLDQFKATPAYTYSHPVSGFPIGVRAHPYGSDEGDLISNWPADAKSTGVLMLVWAQGLGLYTTAGTSTPMHAVRQIFSDSWLGGPPAPPPLPPLPPIVAGAPSAGPINYGTPGSNGAGSGGSLDGDGRNVVTFDYAAFCNKPGSDGAPRSPSFVAACLSGSGK